MFAPIDNSPAANREPQRARGGPTVVARHSIVEAYEDRLLAQVARWNDQAAFEEIYTRHFPVVTAAAMRICNDVGAAEDIAQQAFTTLWIRAERLTAKSLRLRSWLCTVARNAALDHVRAANRSNVSCDDLTGRGSPTSGPEESVVFAESAAQLRRAMATLSPEQHAAVQLVYFWGMTYPAAAQVSGRSAGTMKTRVRLAVARMRASFDRCSSKTAPQPARR